MLKSSSISIYWLYRRSDRACVRVYVCFVPLGSLSPVSPFFLFMLPSGPGPTGCARLVVTQCLAWLLGHSCHVAVGRGCRMEHKILRHHCRTAFSVWRPTYWMETWRGQLSTDHSVKSHRLIGFSFFCLCKAAQESIKHIQIAPPHINSDQCQSFCPSWPHSRTCPWILYIKAEAAAAACFIVEVNVFELERSKTEIWQST